MAYDLATFTNSGNQLLASVVSDKSSLVIDKIEVSNTQLASSTDLKSMTSISNVVQTLSANGYQKKDNSFIISTVLDNSSVTADYKAWVFGIWAHEADGGSPILMSVITSTSSPDTISKGSGTPIDYNYKFITTFSNTSSLTIQMASDTYATNDTVLHNSGDETSTGTKTFQEIKISNDKFPNLVQTDGQYITLDGGNTEIVPADNSKVVHTTGDETIDGQKKFDTDPTDSAGNAYAKTIDVNQQLDKKVNVSDEQMQVIPNGTDLFSLFNTQHRIIHYIVSTTAAANTMVNAPTPSAFALDTIPISSNYPNWNYTLLRFRSLYDNKTYYSNISTDGTGTPANSGWTPNILDNKDGTITLNGKKITPADDSKVAHLSGTNNFDTIPTVKNNPLLLASSLPSDLARTGSDQEFTGKNTFDTAPIDKTTGNPYITKDGVPSIPSDVARTGQSQTFTAAQTFSIAPTIKDASTDKGDNQAATMADLKSVEKSAWRQLNVASDYFGSYEGIYKINFDEKFIEICASGIMISSNKVVTLFDLSPIVDKILKTDMQLVVFDYPYTGDVVNFNGPLITAPTRGNSDSSQTIKAHISSYTSNGFARVYYDNLQPGVI